MHNDFLSYPRYKGQYPQLSPLRSADSKKEELNLIEVSLICLPIREGGA